VPDFRAGHDDSGEVDGLREQVARWLEDHSRLEELRHPDPHVLAW
jgi:hypothetical protein